MKLKSAWSSRFVLALCSAALAGWVVLDSGSGPLPAQDAKKEEPKIVPGGFGGRRGEARTKLIEEEGGNQRSEAAVAAGLKWIVRHQAVDGHWGMHDFHVHGKCNCSGLGGNHDVAGTAFGLLPLLGAGQHHRNATKDGLYSNNVMAGLKWLISKQGADGRFSGNGYEHALATIALCEAYGMTSDQALKGPAQKAIDACVAWQHTAGGFRYAPKTAGDMSVSSWFIQALASGKTAGLNVPDATLAGCSKFLDAVGAADGSGYGYTMPNPAPTMTAAGLLARENLGAKRDSLDKGIELLEKVPPGAIKSIYHYYHATQAVRHYGGEPWDKWNPKMRDGLIDSQDQGVDADHKDQKGSWTAAGDAWGGQLGRLGYTSLALLTLEVYSRHVPLYPREKK